MTWLLWTALAAVVGIVIGYFAGRTGSAGIRRSVALDSELRAARDELDRYRSGVVEHFTTTARLINRLTADYREVYQHLSRGAQELAGGHVPHLEALAAPRAERLDDDGSRAHGNANGAATRANGAGDALTAAVEPDDAGLEEVEARAPERDAPRTAMVGDEDLTLDRDERIVPDRASGDGVDGVRRDARGDGPDEGPGDGWYDDAAPGAEVPDYARDGERRAERRTGAGSD